MLVFDARRKVSRAAQESAPELALKIVEILAVYQVRAIDR
jgi:hypothetical protein